ncbi:MAG: ABC transporter substrate-binding protein [bacterium]
MTDDGGHVALRIISLLPGGTEIVVALGALDSLVGITHECDYPPSVTTRPRVTASTVDREAASAEIDAAVRVLSKSGMPVFALEAGDLRRLAPNVILTQSLCDVCAVSEGDVQSIASVLDPSPRVVALVGTTLDGVWTDIRTIGDAIGRGAAADILLADLDNRLKEVHRVLKAARAPRPRVAVVEWLDPLFAAGHWTPELVKRGGGIDVLAEAGAHSVEVSVERIRSARPELLLFAPCGFDIERSEREARALFGTDEWAWARDIEAWAIDGNALTSRPGPRLANAIEVIAAIVAPRLFAAPSPSYARRLQA